ncbi:transposase [Cupriavidus pinatubonensis]|uniref:Integrase catalytic domain-containing protein n=1 Tax=Cupriavidus pinatubonensis TaxID=248026 RepID=A0ABM8XKB0_9BURK|nr:transposase [Cupriavidus pinatubonensis]CAG9180650.1 hypothetical protein LMG23994_04468 [Cupriavidus pinatubonensis]
MDDVSKSNAADMKTLIPVAGMRFTYHSTDFEIGHAAYAEVRYNAIAGGKSFRMPIARFHELVDAGEIVVSSESLLLSNSPYLIFTEKEMKERVRRLQYAKGATTELTKPTAQSKLKVWVNSFAKRLQDSDVPGASSVARWVKSLREYGEEHFLNGPRRAGNWTLRFGANVEAGIQDGLADYMKAEKKSTTGVLAHVHGYLLSNGATAEQTPSLRTIRRRIKKIDPYLLMRVKQGPIAAERAMKAGGRTRSAAQPMFCVEIDSHMCDVLVVDELTKDVVGRPILTVAIDIRTRCIVGWHMSMYKASATTTLAVVKDMFTRPTRGLPGGIPVHLIPDNGVEFANTPVMRLMVKAQVIIEPARVREPNDKPHVESFFRTFTTQLSHSLPGTTFSNPVERGEYKSEKRACLTLDQVKGYAEKWIEEVYHKTPHTSTGRAPIMLWREETGKAKPRTMSEDEVNVIARTPYLLSINRGRVRQDNLAWFSHALQTLKTTHKGKVVVLIDDMDLRKVYIEDPRNKGAYIVAESTDPEYTTGLTRSMHRAARDKLAEFTSRDLEELGDKAPLYALFTLMQEIQKDSAFAQKQIRRLREGKKELDKRAEKVTKAMDRDTTIPTSRMQAASGIPADLIDPDTGEISAPAQGVLNQEAAAPASEASFDDDADITILN